MSDSIYDIILFAKKDMLKQELAELRNAASRLSPHKDYRYFMDRYRDYELCSEAVDFLTGIDWHASIDRELLYIIDRLTDQGIFLSNLIEWANHTPDWHAQNIREVINGFAQEIKETWHVRFGVHSVSTYLSSAK